MAPIFSKNKCKCMLLSKFLPVLYLSIMFSLSGCLKSSNTGSSSNNSSAQSSSTKGPKGDAGPAGPAGTPSLFLYDINNVKIGSWLLYYDGGYFIFLWDNDNEVFGRYQNDGTPYKYVLPTGRLNFPTSNCTGTPYIFQDFPRGTNVVFTANNQIYRSTNIFVDVITQSEIDLDGSCLMNNLNNVSNKMLEAVLYPGTLPISITGPISISRH